MLRLILFQLRAPFEPRSHALWRADPNGEVGSTVVLGGKYYMLFGGGHIYSSDDPIQGYTADSVNWAFHTDGQGVAFSRLWNVQGDNSTVLLSHQWLSGNRNMGSKGIYLAPLKQLKVGADGTPRATYWIGNEKLKGDSISLPPLPPPSPPDPLSPPMTVVDISGCGGPEEHWKLPTVGGSATTISLNATACLAVEGDQVRGLLRELRPPRFLWCKQRRKQRGKAGHAFINHIICLNYRRHWHG